MNLNELRQTRVNYFADNTYFYGLFAQACENGNDHDLRDIIESNPIEILQAWLTRPYKEGRTCFECACVNGHETIVEAILVKFPNFVEQLLTRENYFESTPVQLACARTSKKVLVLLLKALPNHMEAFLTKKDSVDSTILHYLIINKLNDVLFDVLNLCSSQGLRYLSQIDEVGNTPLHVACQNGAIEEISTIINSLGKQSLSLFQILNFYDMSPLHIACSLGNVRTLNTIVEQFGDSVVSLMSLPNSKGNTPVHCACEKGYDFLVKAILDKTAGLNLVSMRNQQGDTPLHIACQKGFTSVAVILLDWDINQASVQNKALLTPLQVLIQKKNNLTLQSLLVKFPHLIGQLQKNEIDEVILNAFSEGNGDLVIAYAPYLDEPVLLNQTIEILFQKHAKIAARLDEDLRSRIDPLLAALATSPERNKINICKERWLDILEAKHYRLNRSHLLENNHLNETLSLFPPPDFDLESLRKFAQANSLANSQEFSGLYNLLDCVKERKPFVGTPPEGPSLEKFYTILSAVLKHYAYNCSDKLVVCNQFNELGGHCGERWLINSLNYYRKAKSNTTPTPPTKNSISLPAKDGMLLCLHAFREHLLERVIAKRFGSLIDVHQLGYYERRIGPIFGIMETGDLTRDYVGPQYISDEGEIVKELFELYIPVALFWEARDFFVRNRDDCVEVAKSINENDWSNHLTETGLLSSKQLGQYLTEIGVLEKIL